MNLCTQRMSRLLLAAGLIAATIAMAGCGKSEFSTPQQAPALAFVAPPSGATAEVGKPIAITLNVTNAAAFTGGIYVIGQGSLGSVQIPAQAPYTATLAVPADLDLGDYMLTAVGRTDASGNPITAATTVRIVPNPTIPIELQLPQGGLVFEAIGERLPITVPGTRTGSLLYVSAAPAIATVTAAGIVIAQQAGDTTIQVSLAPPAGSFIGSVPVRVLAPALLPAPARLDFGNQATGTTSAAQTVTLTNAAAYPVTVLELSSGTVFPASGDCISASPLAPGAACTISVNFAPTATGSVSGVLEIIGNAVIAPTRILCTGTGS